MSYSYQDRVVNIPQKPFTEYVPEVQHRSIYVPQPPKQLIQRSYIDNEYLIHPKKKVIKKQIIE